MLLSGGTTFGGLRAARAGLSRAVRASLSRRALEAFSDNALNVRSGSRAIWDEPNIQTMGEAWEAFDAARTGYRLTPRTYPAFDQFSADGLVGISNKVVDVTAPSYSRRGHLFQTLRTYINQAADYPPPRWRGQVLAIPRERRLHILLPHARPTPGQALQLTAAEAYARSRGVIIVFEYSR